MERNAREEFVFLRHSLMRLLSWIHDSHGRLVKFRRDRAHRDEEMKKKMNLEEAETARLEKQLLKHFRAESAPQCYKWNGTISSPTSLGPMCPYFLRSRSLSASLILAKFRSLSFRLRISRPENGRSRSYREWRDHPHPRRMHYSSECQRGSGSHRHL